MNNYPPGVTDVDIDRAFGDDGDYDREPTPMTITAWAELRNLIDELADHDVKLVADYAAAEATRRAAYDARQLARLRRVA